MASVYRMDRGSDNLEELLIIVSAFDIPVDILPDTFFGHKLRGLAMADVYTDAQAPLLHL